MPRRHFRNFIDCIRSRTRKELNGEILEGYQSTLLAHLGNVSYRLGENVPFDTQTKALGGDKLAFEAFENMKQHLGEAAHLKLTSSTYRLGRLLRFDAEAERFIGDSDADKLLTRPYRAPFIVPEQV